METVFIRSVLNKMISNEIQELISNIAQSLNKITDKDFETLISSQSADVANVDFHRCEISHREVSNIKFASSSFRGAFVDQSAFINCEFFNCLFIATAISETKFTHCSFVGCVFRSTHMEGNLIEACSFSGCYIEDNVFSTMDSVGVSNQAASVKAT